MARIQKSAAWAVAVIGLLISDPVSATVQLKTGAYSLGFIDLNYPGGAAPKVERFYSSKARQHGVFGWGWGSPYETSLAVTADGSVRVNERGGSLTNLFIPENYGNRNLEDDVKKLTEIADQLGRSGDSGQRKIYQEQLRNDPVFRLSEFEKAVSQRKLESRKLAEGTRLISSRYPGQVLSRIPGGFSRTLVDGSVKSYSEAGWLVKWTSPTSRYLTLRRDGVGHLIQLEDDSHRRMSFSYNPRGLLSVITGEGQVRLEYLYNDQDELISSKDGNGKSYAYKYSGDKHHNLIELGFPDQSKESISYFGPEKKESVKSLKTADGQMHEYDYKTDPADALHETGSGSVKDPEGKTILTFSEDYFFKRKLDGTRWLYRLNERKGGQGIETTFSECCGLPLLIHSEKEEIAFSYNSFGRVTKKESSSEVSEFTYDSTGVKLIRVRRTSKTDPGRIFWAEYQYDPKGNLVLARNSKKRAVRLFYQSHSKPVAIVDQSQRRLDLQYDEDLRPVQVKDSRLGALRMTYRNSGQILSIESTAGPKVARQIRKFYEGVLELIGPARSPLSG